jgi:hypothetical protein
MTGIIKVDDIKDAGGNSIISSNGSGTFTYTFNAGSIAQAALAADIIDGTKLADDAINSEHYTDGSIDNAHIADDAIDSEHYADGSIDNAHIADGAVDTEEIANDAITLAKMASGTDGNIISYDASGNPVAIATGSDGQVLTSAGAGQPPAFEAVSAGTALTGSTNNTIPTVTGANAISGEANLTFDGTDLAIASGNVNVASGYGIDFSATGDAGGITGSAMSAEILDDYEEGTFTLVPYVDSGSMTLDDDKNTGSYVKIGNLVICQGLFTMDDGTGAGGYIGMNGLPFTSSTSLAERQADSVGSLYISGASSAVAGGVICWIEGANTTFLALRESGTTAAGNTLTNHFDDGTAFTFSISYRTV